MVNTFLLQSLVIDLLKSVNGLSKGYQQHGCLSIDCILIVIDFMNI